MANYVLVEGDVAKFLPAFGVAVVTVKDGTLQSSAKGLKVNGKKVCVSGDESKIKIPGCTYIAGTFTVPGTGTLSIKKVAADQLSAILSDGGKKVLLKGSMFDAGFKVDNPAKFIPPPPASPQTDPVKEYMGKGIFQTKNHLLSAS